MMIFRLHGAARSFRSTISRCLSPPPGSGNTPWTTTRHLNTPDPLPAAQEMAAAVAAGAQTKAAAGIRGGRPLEKPVFHYTIYWHCPLPGADIRRAVTDSLAVLGLDEHQAVLIGRDGPVPHVHVVVNRVSLRDGRAASLAWIGLKLHRWRQRWERERGVIPLDRAPPLVHDDLPPGAA